MEPAKCGSDNINPKSTVFKSRKALKGKRVQIRNALREARSIDLIFENTMPMATSDETMKIAN